MIKLLILDVDGVLTDGTKVYDLTGLPTAKRFCDLDFTAIKKFKTDGWRVVWLSADKNVNEAVAKDRNVEFCYSRTANGTIDKVAWLESALEQYRCCEEPVEIIYVGDDLFDLAIMRAVQRAGGRAFCPNNAAPQVQMVATVLGRAGGAGAVMDLYWNYISKDDTPPSH